MSAKQQSPFSFDPRREASEKKRLLASSLSSAMDQAPVSPDSLSGPVSPTISGNGSISSKIDFGPPVDKQLLFPELQASTLHQLIDPSPQLQQIQDKLDALLQKCVGLDQGQGNTLSILVDKLNAALENEKRLSEQIEQMEKRLGALTSTPQVTSIDFEARAQIQTEPANQKDGAEQPTVPPVLPSVDASKRSPVLTIETEGVEPSVLQMLGEMEGDALRKRGKSAAQSLSTELKQKLGTEVQKRSSSQSRALKADGAESVTQLHEKKSDPDFELKKIIDDDPVALSEDEKESPIDAETLMDVETPKDSGKNPSLVSTAKKYGLSIQQVKINKDYLYVHFVPKVKEGSKHTYYCDPESPCDHCHAFFESSCKHVKAGQPGKIKALQKGKSDTHCLMTPSEKLTSKGSSSKRKKMESNDDEQESDDSTEGKIAKAPRPAAKKSRTLDESKEEEEDAPPASPPSSPPPSATLKPTMVEVDSKNSWNTKLSKAKPYLSIYRDREGKHYVSFSHLFWSNGKLQDFELLKKLYKTLLSPCTRDMIIGKSLTTTHDGKEKVNLYLLIDPHVIARGPANNHLRERMVDLIQKNIQSFAELNSKEIDMSKPIVAVTFKRIKNDELNASLIWEQIMELVKGVCTEQN